MAPKSKPVSIKAGASFEDIVNAIKFQDPKAVVGTERIAQFCTEVRIPTGIPSIDYLTSGGFKQGTINILGGPEGGGKSTASITMAKSFSDFLKTKGDDRLSMYINVEGAYDHAFAMAMGNDGSRMWIRRDKVIEEAFKFIEDQAKAGFINSLFIDSVDWMVSRKVMNAEYGDTMGGTAGALAAHLPILHESLIETGVTTVLIKQARDDLKGFSPNGGTPIKLSGGRALRHACDTILIMKPKSFYKLNYRPVDINANKTRSCRNGKTIEAHLSFFKPGFDMNRSLVYLAKMHPQSEIFDISGSWITFDGERRQGEENLLAFLDSSPEKAAKLRDMVYERIVSSDYVCEDSGEVEVVDTE